MNLVSVVEKYLNEASGLTFDDENPDDPLLIIWFDDKKFNEFRSPDNYSKVVEFFSGRVIALTILEKADEGKDEYYYRSSFVDKGTADVVNLNFASWGQNDLHAFREKIKQDTKMKLTISLIDRPQQKLLPHEMTGSHSPLIVDGFIFKEAESKENESEDNS